MTELHLSCAVCGSDLEVVCMSVEKGIQIEPCPDCVSRVKDRVAKLRAALDQFEKVNGQIQRTQG